MPLNLQLGLTQICDKWSFEIQKFKMFDQFRMYSWIYFQQTKLKLILWLTESAEIIYGAVVVKWKWLIQTD